MIFRVMQVYNYRFQVSSSSLTTKYLVDGPLDCGSDGEGIKPMRAENKL